MPIRANDIETLHDFAVGVMARAGHQTNEVRAIILALLGGIVRRVEPGSLEIRFQNGNRANAVRWISVTGNEYSCTYNNQSDQIEVHDHNSRGSVLHTFSNATSMAEVERIFATL